jgi:hypothetical protein
MLRKLARRLPAPLRRIARKFGNWHRRRSMARRYYADRLAMIERWAWRDTESSNFYYRLTPSNRDHLAHALAVVTGESHDAIVRYFDEIEGDEQLRMHIQQSLKSTDYGRDIRVNFGRRIGWYALVRTLKPAVVVETGVDHGVGSCVLASALLRNVSDGSSGRYFGTEVRPEAGQLFREPYTQVGSILYDDSIRSLQKLEGSVDLFINDSDHSGEYEYQEYLAIEPKLSSRAVILGDNAHVTDSLSRFSRERGRKFIFFAEKPSDHWYPGAGIGISYR